MARNLRGVRRAVLVPLLLVTLVACTGAHRTAPPARNSNGRIAALVMRGGGPITGDLYTFQADGSDLQRLTRTGDMTVSFVFSPDGSAIAFAQTSSEFSWNIGVMSADGTDRRLLTNTPPTMGSPSYIFPSWLPDGGGIRYFRNDGNGPELGKGEGLWVVNPDGTHAHQLNLRWDPFEVVWSPDGTRLAWVGNDGLYVENADSTGHRQLTSGFKDSEPTWSPDGSKLAFMRDGAIHVVNADGTGERVVFACDTTCTSANFPVWSPDGTRIAFTVGSGLGGQQTKVEIMNADGTDVVSVPGLPRVIASLAWQPVPQASS